MAISTPTILSSTTGVVNATTFDGGSISPTANSLLVAFCMIGSAAVSTHLEPTLTGLSLTWTRRASIESTLNNRFAIAVFTALAGSSPGSGAPQVTWAVAGNRHAMHIVEIASGYHATSYVAQSKTNAGTGTAPTVTLDATPAADSLVLGGLCARHTTAQTATPGGTFTELADVTAGASNPFTTTQTQYDQDSAPAAVAWTVATSANMVMLALEIAAAAAGGGGIILPVMSGDGIASVIFGGQIVR